MPGQRHELHHRICNLRYETHGYGMSAYKRGRISYFDFMNIVSTIITIILLSHRSFQCHL